MSKLYQHFKGNYYRYIDTVKFSEDLSEFVLYETLYDNPEAKLWVRSKKMFFEKISRDGISAPRFKEKEIVYQNLDEKNLFKNELEKTWPFIHSIFTQNLSVEKILSQIADKNKFLLQLALLDDKPIGFKLGYELNNETFYSWLGGIEAKFRSLGIASVLMQNQYAWCKKNGYKKIQTKSQNQWKEMIILNLKNDFEIIGVEESQNAQKEKKIIFEKLII